MFFESIARRYAKALFDAALDEKKLDAVKSQLDQLLQTLESNPRLQLVWNSGRLLAETKKDFSRKAFPFLSPLVLNYLFLLIDKKREKILKASVEEFEKLLLDYSNRCIVEVRSVAPIPENIQLDLKARLSERLGKKVELVMKEEASLIGGIVVQMGDIILDGSLRTKLEKLREELLSAPLPFN
jgi:F-type H+-transporting ATPase subunit delta